MRQLNTIAKARSERAYAESIGLRTYYTWRPCKNGHFAERNTVDASCVQCREIDHEVRGRAWQREHQRKVRAARTPEQVAAYNVTRAKELREYRKMYPEKVRERERYHSRLKRQRYPERKLAETRLRQAAKIQRTPKWADVMEIRHFYEACPDGHEVDHIVPLRGKIVSGLHVLNNLQYLPKIENRLKGSKFEPIVEIHV